MCSLAIVPMVRNVRVTELDADVVRHWGGVSTWPIYAILDPLAPLVDSPPTDPPQLFDYAIGIVIGPIVIVLLTTSQLNGIIE